VRIHKHAVAEVTAARDAITCSCHQRSIGEGVKRGIEVRQASVAIVRLSKTRIANAVVHGYVGSEAPFVLTVGFNIGLDQVGGVVKLALDKGRGITNQEISPTSQILGRGQRHSGRERVTGAGAHACREGGAKGREYALIGASRVANQSVFVLPIFRISGAGLQRMWDADER